MCNSMWGSNEEDGKSATGHVLHFEGVPVTWKSNCQPNVSLSSSEAECLVTSELVKEALFVLQIMEDDNISNQQIGKGIKIKIMWNSEN